MVNRNKVLTHIHTHTLLRPEDAVNSRLKIFMWPYPTLQNQIAAKGQTVTKATPPPPSLTYKWHCLKLPQALLLLIYLQDERSAANTLSLKENILLKVLLLTCSWKTAEAQPGLLIAIGTMAHPAAVRQRNVCAGREQALFCSLRVNTADNNKKANSIWCRGCQPPCRFCHRSKSMTVFCHCFRSGKETFRSLISVCVSLEEDKQDTLGSADSNTISYQRLAVPTSTWVEILGPLVGCRPVDSTISGLEMLTKLDSFLSLSRSFFFLF